MFQNLNRWLVLCLALVVVGCGTQGDGAADVESPADGTGDVGAPTATDEQADDPSQSDTDTSDAGTQTGDETTDTSDAGTQTDDESTDTNDAGTQTDDESTDTSDAGTQTDDESTDTSDAGTQTDDETTDTNDAGTQTDDASTDSDSNTDDASDAADDTTPTDTDEEDTYDLNDKWEGSYTCTQGFTRLTLQMTHDTGTNSLDAIFAFYADDSNPDVPTGRYTMTGTFDPNSRAVDLDIGEWIEQPGGYVMVPLDGTLNEEGTTIDETVGNLGCTDFTVMRGN